LDARKLRDALNERLGGLLVAAVECSARGNLMISLMPGVPAADFLGKKPLWAPVFETFTILRTEESRLWLQLVAYGVPMRDFTGLGAADLAAEFHTFNPTITFVGGIRWIT
jgi:energy-converting hydrogenase Eha subunit G